MSYDLTIALDAMGGDLAPLSVLRGADQFLTRNRFKHAKFIVFGDEKQIQPILKNCQRLKRVCEVVHTDDVVMDTDKPSAILRRGDSTSMGMAIQAVADGRANCIVSGGNTGALMVLARKIFGMLPGIERPAITGTMPAVNQGQTTVLDLGANVEVNEKHLLQFALMGGVFARHVDQTENPRIGLLNIGQEEQKGHAYLQRTSELLQSVELPGKYIGFVEGNDISAGTVDVVVTDGFTGNVLLKTTEGTARLISSFFRGGAKKLNWWDKLRLLLAKKTLRRIAFQADPRKHNGAMFLGLNGICVKSHGSMDEVGINYAIKTAAVLVEGGFIQHVNTDLPKAVSSLEETMELNTDQTVAAKV